MTNYTTELYHHGRLGQRWGRKNGPPYPLDFSKLSEAERSEAKQKSINEGDVRTAAKNKKYYTNQELNDVMSRFDINARLDSYNAKTIKTGADYVKKACNTMGDIGTYGNKVINGYNVLAKVSNSFLDTDMPIVSDKNKDKDKNNKNSKSNK